MDEQDLELEGQIGSSSSSLLYLKKDQVLCVEGEVNFDLFMINSGKLLVCVSKGSQIIPLAYLGKGAFLGELSFFDHRPRSANVIAVEDSVVVKVPASHSQEYFPKWLLTLARFMTKRIRSTDEIIREKGLKKTNVEIMKPLSIQEQGHYFKILKTHNEAKA